MKKLDLISIEEAENRIDRSFNDYSMATEELSLTESRGRILAENIISPIDVPDYRRSTIDGYAVLASDIQMASEANPVLLKYTGKTEMGLLSELVIRSGETVYVPTGGMVPNGADAMVMQEFTERIGDQVKIKIDAVGKDNMIPIGGDIQKDSIVLKKGIKIRTQEIGAMASIGKLRVQVLQKPRISILCTGDELIPMDAPLQPGKIRDMNTMTLKMIAEELGCVVVRNDLIKDDFARIQQAVEKAVSDSDVVVVSGGSSVGEKDVTADVFNAIQEGSVILHGIRVKPGKPTIVAKLHNKPVFGLPGHPVSALNIFRIFVKRALERIQKQPDTIPRMVQAKSVRSFKTASERDTYQMVKFTDSTLRTFDKVTGKSGMITLLTQADGYILVRAEEHVVQAGQSYDVVLFD